MQIAIEIPKYIVDMCKASGCVIDADTEKVGKAIANGTPLPEQHSDLIERDALKQRIASVFPMVSAGVTSEIDAMPTIIPATEEEQIEKCCFTCKWDYSNFKEYVDEEEKLAHCRKCKQASGYEPMKAGRQSATEEGE